MLPSICLWLILSHCLHFLNCAVLLLVGLFIYGKPFQISAMKQSSLLGPFVSISKLVTILKVVFANNLVNLCDPGANIIEPFRHHFCQCGSKLFSSRSRLYQYVFVNYAGESFMTSGSVRVKIIY